MMLFLETTKQKLTVLPTHRIVRGLGDEASATCWTTPAWLFDVEAGERSRRARSRLRLGRRAGRRGPVRAVDARSGGAVLTARRDDFAMSLTKAGPRSTAST
jgi:hypothetical protein